jgi:hypothetical protein
MTFDARGQTDYGKPPSIESQPAYQVAQSLKEFAPTLNRALDYVGKQWIKQGIQQGQAQYNQNPAYWGKLISQEPDPVVRSQLKSMNPWAADAVERSVAKAAVTEYSPWLRTLVAGNPVIDEKTGKRLLDAEPGDGQATEFIAKQRSTFLAERGLSQVSPRVFTEEVAPVLSGGEQQATEIYYSRAAEAKKQRVEASQQKAMVGIIGAVRSGDAEAAQKGFDDAFFAPNAGPWTAKTIPEQTKILDDSVLSQVTSILSDVAAGKLAESDAAQQLRTLEATSKKLAVGSPLAAEGRFKPFQDDPELSAKLGSAVTKAILDLPNIVSATAQQDYRRQMRDGAEKLVPDENGDYDRAEVAQFLEESRNLPLEYLKKTGDQAGTLELEQTRQKFASLYGSTPRDESAYNKFSALISGYTEEGVPLPNGPLSAMDALKQVGGGDYLKGLDLVAGTGDQSMQERAQIFGQIKQDTGQAIEREERALREEQQRAEREAREQERQYNENYRIWQGSQQKAIQAAGQIASEVQSSARLALETSGATPQQKNNILNALNQQLPFINQKVMEKYGPLMQQLSSPDPKVAAQARATLDSADFVLRTKAEVKAAAIGNIPGLAPMVKNLPQGGEEGAATFGGVTQAPIKVNPSKKLWGNYSAKQLGADFTAIMNGKEPSEGFKQRIRERSGGQYSPGTVIDTLATYLPQLAGDKGPESVAGYKRDLIKHLAQKKAEGIDNPLTRYASGEDINPPGNLLEQAGRAMSGFFNKFMPKKPEPTAGNFFMQPAYADMGVQIPMGMDRAAVMRAARATKIPPPVLAAAVAASGGYGGPKGGAMSELLRRIRSGEGSYTSINTGVAGDTPGGMPGLTSMSVGEIMRRQRDGAIFAVGAYQFIPETLSGVVSKLKIPPTAKFTPALQDRLAQELILGGEKRPLLSAYLKGQSNDAAGALRELSQEWAAIRGPGGAGAYDGDSAGNMASVSVGDLLPRLRQQVMGGHFSSGGTNPRVVANGLAAAQKQARREGKGLYRALEIVGGKDYANQVINHAKVLGWGDQATITQFAGLQKGPFVADNRSKQIWVDPSGPKRGRQSVKAGYNHIQFGNSADKSSNDLTYKLIQAKAADALLRKLHSEGVWDVEIPYGVQGGDFNQPGMLAKFLKLPVKERLRRLVKWGDSHHKGTGLNEYWAIDINFPSKPGSRYYLPGYGRIVSSSVDGGVVTFASGVEVVHATGLQGSW